ncbi:MAG: PAS domain S-box protein [Deltaproteobacteria bacterium]|nr:PAS domain S-box protein [Deltaproteobacteria bacterium]
MKEIDNTEEQLRREVRELRSRLAETEANKNTIENELENLRASAERERMLLETMEEGVVLIDPGGKITHANPAAEKILGFKRSQIESRHYMSPEWEILRSDGTPMPPEEMPGPLAMKEKRIVRNTVMGVKRPEGNIAWIVVSAAPIITEKNMLAGVVGTFKDITSLREAEEEYRQLQERLQNSLAKVISGFLPICAGCKMIRDEKSKWNSVEVFIEKRTGAEFTHTLCPSCTRELYPEYTKKK